MLLPGALLHYDFTRDPFCDRALDLSGKNSDGSDKRAIINGATWVPQGLSFDGNDYCDINPNADSDITSVSDASFCLGAVFYLDPTNNASAYIICKSLASYNDAQFSMYYDSYGGGLMNGYINTSSFRSTLPIKKGIFNFALLTVSSKSVTWHINGVLDRNISTTINNINSKPNFFIGCRSNTEDGTQKSIFFKGIISEIFLCRCADSQSVINWFIATNRHHKYGIKMGV